MDLVIHTFKPCVGCGQVPVINTRLEVIDRHNCRYVQTVNALIEPAAEAAEKSFAYWKTLHPNGIKQDPGSDWAIEGREFPKTEDEIWDEMYHRAMERMRREAGVPLRRV
jgi:hypothetical protein